jgi:hypothetical protein
MGFASGEVEPRAFYQSDRFFKKRLVGRVDRSAWLQQATRRKPDARAGALVASLRCRNRGRAVVPNPVVLSFLEGWGTKSGAVCPLEYWPITEILREARQRNSTVMLDEDFGADLEEIISRRQREPWNPPPWD